MSYSLKHNNMLMGLSLVILSMAVSCMSKNKVNTQKENVFFKTEDAYFGLTPPGLTPEVFAPCIVSDSSWAEHCQLAISPKGDEIYWSAWSSKYTKEDGRSSTEQIYFSEFKNGTWSTPALAEFVLDHLTIINGGPVFSPDGNKLYFYSVDRPGGLGSMDTWYVERTENGWGTPVNAGKPYNSAAADWTPIFTAKGTAYVNFDGTKKFIYDNEGFSKPDSVVFHKGFKPVFPVYVSPDESYVIFDSFKEGNFGDLDLYITFKTENGTWSDPLNMGSKINTKSKERFPMVSPDGKYFFFVRHTANQDIFWVSTEIFKELKKQSESK